MNLTFITGSSIRRVFIKDRQLTLITPEYKFQPVTLDLSKLRDNEDKVKQLKLTPMELNDIKKLSELGSEEEIANDIIKDFKKSGWRLIKKE